MILLERSYAGKSTIATTTREIACVFLARFSRGSRARAAIYLMVSRCNLTKHHTTDRCARRAVVVAKWSEEYPAEAAAVEGPTAPHDTAPSIQADRASH